MSTLYGKYPKRISCDCNAGDTNDDSITIYLNDRCPICNGLHRIHVPKPKVIMKKVSMDELLPKAA